MSWSHEYTPLHPCPFEDLTEGLLRSVVFPGTDDTLTRTCGSNVILGEVSSALEDGLGAASLNSLMFCLLCRC